MKFCYDFLTLSVFVAVVHGGLPVDSSLAQLRWTTPVHACIRVYRNDVSVNYCLQEIQNDSSRQRHNLDKRPLMNVTLDVCRASCEVHAECCAVEFNRGRCARSEVKRGAHCPDGDCYTQPCYGYADEIFTELVDRCNGNGLPAGNGTGGVILINKRNVTSIPKCVEGEILQPYCGSCHKTCNATGHIDTEICVDFFLPKGVPCPAACICAPGYFKTMPVAGRRNCVTALQCAAGCRDTLQYARKCHEWRKAGFCDKHQFVRKHCRVTCGLCTVPT